MANYKFSRAAPTNPYATIAGRRIRAARRSLNWTQEELAKATNDRLSATRIANYEQGTRELSIQPAIILGDALRQPPSYLMGLVDELDRDILMFSAEVKVAMLGTLKAMTQTAK